MKNLGAVSKQQAIEILSQLPKSQMKYSLLALGLFVLILALAVALPIAAVEYLSFPRRAEFPIILVFLLSAFFATMYVMERSLRRRGPVCASCKTWLQGTLLAVAIASGNCGKCGGAAFIQEERHVS